MPQFENNTFEVGEEVIVHTKDGRGRDHEEYPGKITAVARQYVTIEYRVGDGGRGYTRTDRFHMETRSPKSEYGDTLSPWFERPWEKDMRLAVQEATEILHEHGFEIARHGEATHTKILAVAAFLEGHKGQESIQPSETKRHFVLRSTDEYEDSVYFRYEITGQPNVRTERGRLFTPQHADVMWQWVESRRGYAHSLSVWGRSILKSGKTGAHAGDLLWATQDLDERFTDLPDWVQEIYSAACAEYAAFLDTGPKS